MDKKQELAMLAKPLNEWLQKNFHPHSSIIITFDSAEVVEGRVGVTFKILD